MEKVLMTELKNLNEKLDTIFKHIENIEKKVDKIDERQSEQSRIIGEYRIQIEHIETDIVEINKKHDSDLNMVWDEFRRKEKALGAVILAMLGFIGKIVFDWLSNGGK